MSDLAGKELKVILIYHAPASQPIYGFAFLLILW